MFHDQMHTACKSTQAMLLAAGLQAFCKASNRLAQVGAAHNRYLPRTNKLLQASTHNINEFAEAEDPVLPNATLWWPSIAILQVSFECCSVLSLQQVWACTVHACSYKPYGFQLTHMQWCTLMNKHLGHYSLASLYFQLVDLGVYSVRIASGVEAAMKSSIKRCTPCDVVKCECTCMSHHGNSH